jgi:hypothetical protein
MATKNEPQGHGAGGRFHDLSADVREERLVRYILHQAQSGRHVKDIVNDSYVVEHFDEVARSRILENPEVIKGIEAHMRRQFAGYGDSVAGLKPPSGGDKHEPGRVNDADMSDL